MRRSGRRAGCGVVLMVAGVLSATACVPATPPVAPPSVVLTPTSGPIGTVIRVVLPNDDCYAGKSYAGIEALLYDAVTDRWVTGVGTFHDYFPGNPALGSDSPDSYLQIAPWVTPGRYLVYASCYNYLDSYQYAPAEFTVTPA